MVRPILPLDSELLEGGDARPQVTDGSVPAQYEFEPNPNTLLESLLPSYVRARIYAALLNASASELASRQRAMKSATDNAEELITGLSRIANRIRQESITSEIMEVVSGAESLRKKKKTGPEVVLAENYQDLANVES